MERTIRRAAGGRGKLDPKRPATGILCIDTAISRPCFWRLVCIYSAGNTKLFGSRDRAEWCFAQAILAWLFCGENNEPHGVEEILGRGLGHLLYGRCCVFPRLGSIAPVDAARPFSADPAIEHHSLPLPWNLLLHHGAAKPPVGLVFNLGSIAGNIAGIGNYLQRDSSKVFRLTAMERWQLA
jgi:hypothetical protein